MGQYYKAVILDKDTNPNEKIVVKQAFSSYDYGWIGAKLMEHSYVGNRFVQAVEYALYHYYDGHPFVWCGDYSDGICGVDVYGEASEWMDKNKEEFALANGYTRVENASYGIEWEKDGKCVGMIEKIPYEKFETYKYIINYDKKQFIRIPEKSNKKDKNGYPILTIHPLPLLCADGNQRGGGDYYGRNEKLVGAWAYDRIGIDNELPEDITTELVAVFEESWGDNTKNVNDYEYVERVLD
jgi:hypothetical protein